MKSLLRNFLLASSLLIFSAITAQAAEMQPISREDLKTVVTSSESGYLILDARKVADYEKGHIAGAVSADLAAAVDGDDAAGIATLKSVLTKNAGNETGSGKKIVILCYSGAKYAQKTTDLLGQIGADASSVFTLKGGYKAWTADDSAGDYAKLIVSGKEPGSAPKK